MTTTNTPALRFKEFDGEWKSKKLGEFAQFSKGKGLAKADISDDGKNPCIRYGELYTVYGNVIKNTVSRTNLELSDCVVSQPNQIIIPASGESKLDIATASCVKNGGIILGGDLNIISTDENGEFVANYLSNKKKYDIARVAQGISVIHLYSSQLSKLIVSIPSLEEQTKIADFLTVVDDKITELTQKHKLLTEYKKGVMQQLFSQKIRFKKEDGSDFGEWEETLFSTFILERNIIVDDENTPLYSLTIEDGITGKSDRYKRDFLVKNNESAYKLVKKDDFAINPMNLRFGAISYHREDFNVKVSKYYNIFSINKSIVNLVYFYYFSKSFEMISFYNKMSTGSLLEKRRNHFSDYVNYKKLMPSLEEQTKIAEFLSELDEQISHTQTELDHAKTWKKGLLQKMFV